MAVPAAASASASAPLDLSDGALRNAAARSKGTVRKLAEASGQQLETPRATRDEQFAASIAEAGVPDCLRSDALKRDPPVIGFIAFSGPLAAPFLVHAAITGKCRP